MSLPALKNSITQNGREIISVDQMRAIDARSAELGVPTIDLMENAGAAVAEQIFARFSKRPTAVLCGPGDNGGDGFVVARRLKKLGWPVWVETLADPRALRRDAAEMANRWGGDTLRVSEENPMAELFVDAMFGAGLTRPLEGEAARLARTLARTPERVVAVDTPSGLHGDMGRPLGEACMRAALTVTFIRKKPAHVLQPGRSYCGEVVVADIGSPALALTEQDIRLWENDPHVWGGDFPWPKLDAHKHQRGHAMIVSGPSGQTGAARLAARGALRSGAGLVTVLTPPNALVEHAAQLNAIMLKPFGADAELVQAAAKAGAVVIGPAAGVDAGTRNRVAALAKGAAKLVLDADALSVFADKPRDLFALVREDDVLTPHVGEFQRLFPDIVLPEGRIEGARTAAARAKCVVLLKGPDTIIAAPDGRAAVNATGTPFLATAGSGDVLAGIVAGLAAQGMSGFDAACAGAWLHGRAGERAGPGLIAEDLPEALPSVLDALWRGPNLV
ncbi:MAG: NAD(P)H-hydrate dehydratase [Hyphomonadaceae bacterium]